MKVHSFKEPEEFSAQSFFFPYLSKVRVTLFSPSKSKDREGVKFLAPPFFSLLNAKKVQHFFFPFPSTCVERVHAHFRATLGKSARQKMVKRLSGSTFSRVFSGPWELLCVCVCVSCVI